MKTLKVLILAVMLIAMTISTVLAVTPDVPRLISYQGYLTDIGGGPISDGAHVIQFFIWNDPVLSDPGNQRWWSGVTSVTTTEGLFDILLGNPAMNPIDPDIFVDSNLWLGIVVGADPELSPRTKLTTAPYAFSARLAQTATEAGHAATADNATSADGLNSPLDHGSLSGLGDDDHDQYVQTIGDGMTGDLNFFYSSTNYARIFSSGAYYIYDADANISARFHGNNWGQIQLFDTQVENRNTIEINATYNSGGEVIVRNSSGTETHRLDAGNTGNSSVAFPNDAISADETLEEPGIARSRDNYTGLSDATIVNIVACTITVPGPGYIVARGYGFGALVGTSLGNIIMYISDSPTGTSPAYDEAAWGYNNQSFSSSQVQWGSLVNERTFAVGSSGDYTYYLNAKQGYTDGTATVYDAKLLLTYFPTSYGTVSAVASADEIGQFDEVSSEQTISSSASGKEEPITVYTVDLQELVNKAKAARRAAEQAEMELKIALERQNPAASSVEASSGDQ